jgi:hypothetical protein
VDGTRKQKKLPVRIAWSTRNWWLNISTILMSAGTLQPTYPQKGKKASVN